MITIKKKVEVIKSCFGQPKVSADGKNVNVHCPFCLASGKITKKKKLSIDLEKGIYHCWVCESKGRNVGRVAIKFSQQKDSARLLHSFYCKKSDNDDVIEEELISLPGDFKLIAHLKTSKRFKLHRNYLSRRGFSHEKLQNFRVGVSEEYGYHDRVIFPSFDKDQNLNYFISRSIDPNCNPSFRYKNASNQRKDVIFRSIDLDMKQELVLVEGVFDLVNCPKNSTCILGSWLSDDYLLFREIVANRTPVVLCLDPDAKSKAFKIAKLLSSYCVDVKIAQHTERDFGDMSIDEVNYFISTAKQYDNTNFIGYLIDELHSGSMY